jgi:hypothetical protein
MLDDGINRPEKRLTMEVNSSKQLMQARGRMNKGPDHQESRALNRWMGENNITKTYNYW